MCHSQDEAELSIKWCPSNMASGERSSSSSDEDDEEEKRRLQEASIGFSVVENKELVGSESTGSVLPLTKNIKQKPRKPSLRTDADTEQHETCIEGVTPEFQKFLSKKLMNHFEIDYEDGIDIKADGKDEWESLAGVRLFSSSKTFCTCPSKDVQIVKQKHKLRRTFSSSSDSDSERAKLLEASVTPDSIFHFSATGEYANTPPKDVEIVTQKKKKHKRKYKVDNDVQFSVKANGEQGGCEKSQVGPPHEEKLKTKKDNIIVETEIATEKLYKKHKKKKHRKREK